MGEAVSIQLRRPEILELTTVRVKEGDQARLKVKKLHSQKKQFRKGGGSSDY
jgi:hypothetical protein